MFLNGVGLGTNPAYIRDADPWSGNRGQCSLIISLDSTTKFHVASAPWLGTPPSPQRWDCIGIGMALMDYLLMFILVVGELSPRIRRHYLGMHMTKPAKHFASAWSKQAGILPC